MVGGLGDDTYGVNSSGDVVVESAGAGFDTIESTVTLALAANIENLTLIGATHLNGTGNALNNVVTGNSGNNVLNGGSGADHLFSGGGADTLVGGVGSDELTGGESADFFVFNSSLSASANLDRINDFELGADLICLENAIFTKLTFIYDTATGSVSYDANGSGSGGQI